MEGNSASLDITVKENELIKDKGIINKLRTRNRN